MIFIVSSRGGFSRWTGWTSIEFWDEVSASDTAQTLFYATSFLGFVPEEILSLGELFMLALGTEHGFECIGIIARIPSFGSYRHGGRREVLYLFEMEVELFGDDSQFGHILLLACRVAADEVGDNLLAQVLLVVDTIEDTLELIELLERGFAHQFQHALAGMLRGHFQASAYVSADQFACIFLCGLVCLLVLTPI